MNLVDDMREAFVGSALLDDGTGYQILIAPNGGLYLLQLLDGEIVGAIITEKADLVALAEKVAARG